MKWWNKNTAVKSGQNETKGKLIAATRQPVVGMPEIHHTALRAET